MALTKKDQEFVQEVMRTAFESRSTTHIELMTSQVELNTNIFNEIKKIGESIQITSENSTKILNRVQNGITDSINDIHEVLVESNIAEKIKEVHKDVSSKDGYLSKLSNKLLYLWIPLVPAFLAILIILYKLSTITAIQ